MKRSMPILVSYLLLLSVHQLFTLFDIYLPGVHCFVSPQTPSWTLIYGDNFSTPSRPILAH